MAFTPDEEDLEYAIDDLQDLEFNMEEAIGHVFNNEYILVVGSEVILNPKVESSGDVSDYLMRHLNRKLKSNYRNFDEVMQHSGNEIDPIRNLLTWDKFKQSMVVGDVSEELQGLLRTKLFKTVVTTTFDSYLEILMHDIWGDRLRIVNIWDATSLANLYERFTKCKEVKNYNEPTLIYAFGKCEEKEGCRYARKDFEYIQTIEQWLKFDKHENLLMQFIQSKRLLSLGCKFDDWYFRFFWYILRREEIKQRDGDIAIVFDKNDRSDQNLQNYLKNSRVITQTDVDAREFMRQITQVLTSLEADNPYRDLVTQYRRRGKIFFSYCNKDKALARQIFQQLSQLYPNMWFDQENILGGDNYDTEIRYGISHAKVFIPLLTSQIAEDLKKSKTDNYYNEEWRQAAERKGELAIIPLTVEGYSLREPYHHVFEQIIDDNLSGISLKDANALGNLQKAIDKHLNGHE